MIDFWTAPADSDSGFDRGFISLFDGRGEFCQLAEQCDNNDFIYFLPTEYVQHINVASTPYGS